MPDYHRNRAPGASFFFTVRLLEHGSSLLTEQFAAFGSAVRQVRQTQPLHADAWVVLPDHLHAIWTLPPGDVDYHGRWKAIKQAFSKVLSKSGAARVPAGPLWERRYRDLEIVDEDEYSTLVDYVHLNPLRHGYCSVLSDWPWSSLHRFVGTGFAPPRERRRDWH